MLFSLNSEAFSPLQTKKALRFKMIRHGYHFDGGDAVATQDFEESTVLIGYAISDDISFEEQFHDIWHKRSFGFDCGIN